MSWRDFKVHVGRPVVEPLEHGTLRMYTTGKCRCQLCKTANRDCSRAYQAKKKASAK